MTDNGEIVSIDTATGETAPAELSSERVYRIFSSIAKDYERFNAISSMGFYKSWLEGMVDQAPITSESNVIDVAGGTGDVTFTVARKKQPAHIRLTDFVPDMLEVAKMHYDQGAHGGVPIDFDVVDAQDVPYPDNSYDVITMAYGIRNMPDREKALREMQRILKPGGTFVCLEFSTPPNRVVRSFYSFYLKHMIPFWGRLIVGDREDFIYLSNSIKAFPDQQEYAHMLERAGFTDVEWKNYSGGIAAVHTAKKPQVQ